MTTTPRLHDDLLHEHREEKVFVTQNIERFEPLAAGLRRPAAARVAAAGGSLLLEILCYLGVLAAVGAAVFFRKLYPPYLFARFEQPKYSDMIGPQNVQNLQWLYFGLLAAIALLLLALARTLRGVRLRNAILARTGGSVKTLVGDLLRRKASIDNFEQRHAGELAALAAHPVATGSTVNTAPNPGYDGSENRSFDR